MYTVFSCTLYFNDILMILIILLNLQEISRNLPKFPQEITSIHPSHIRLVSVVSLNSSFVFPH